MSDDLSLTDWCVLALLAEGPRHGFAVARELAADAPVGQVWTVPRPLVYRAVTHLTARSLAEPVRSEGGTRGPNRTVLRATRAGRARLRRWLDATVEHPRDVRTELLVKFVLRDRAGLGNADLAARQRARFVPIAGGLTRALRRARGTERVVARWRLESIRAVDRTLAAVVAEQGRR